MNFRLSVNVTSILAAIGVAALVWGLNWYFFDAFRIGDLGIQPDVFGNITLVAIGLEVIVFAVHALRNNPAPAQAETHGEEQLVPLLVPMNETIGEHAAKINDLYAQIGNLRVVMKLKPEESQK
jgi:hypothetical protein